MVIAPDHVLIFIFIYLCCDTIGQNPAALRWIILAGFDAAGCPENTKMQDNLSHQKSRKQTAP